MMCEQCYLWVEALELVWDSSLYWPVLQCSWWWLLLSLGYYVDTSRGEPRWLCYTWSDTSEKYLCFKPLKCLRLSFMSPSPSLSWWIQKVKCFLIWRLYFLMAVLDLYKNWTESTEFSYCTLILALPWFPLLPFCKNVVHLLQLIKVNADTLLLTEIHSVH